MHVKAQGADDRGGVTQVVGAVGRGGPLPYCLCGGAAARLAKLPAQLADLPAHLLLPPTR